MVSVISLTVPVFPPTDNAPLRVYTVLTCTNAPVELWRPQPARRVTPMYRPFPMAQITALAGRRAKHVSHVGLALGCQRSRHAATGVSGVAS